MSQYLYQVDRCIHLSPDLNELTSFHLTMRSFQIPEENRAMGQSRPKLPV